MPLTGFQRHLLADLAKSPNDDRYLAGGAALHFTPNSSRYSDDLDFFHDSEARVASAFAADRARLEHTGYQVRLEVSIPGFVRAIVARDDEQTRVDWAHDSAWRFMPLVRDPLGGLLLHPVDLAINKTLALAGRDEPRDFVDILFVNQRVLGLAGLVWAAPGKDPGFAPISLLELLKRRGRYHAEDFDRLALVRPIDLVAAKNQWLGALEQAEQFVRARPATEVGCLYYSSKTQQFVLPTPAPLPDQHVVLHFGQPGGILPRVAGQSIELNANGGA